jgi:hypothetical protein
MIDACIVLALLVALGVAVYTVIDLVRLHKGTTS